MLFNIDSYQFTKRYPSRHDCFHFELNNDKLNTNKSNDNNKPVKNLNDTIHNKIACSSLTTSTDIQSDLYQEIYNNSTLDVQRNKYESKIELLKKTNKKLRYIFKFLCFLSFLVFRFLN